MLHNVSRLQEVGDLAIPKLSIKTDNQKYKTNFKLSPKTPIS
jgi:hypothetical protein